MKIYVLIEFVPEDMYPDPEYNDDTEVAVPRPIGYFLSEENARKRITDEVIFLTDYSLERDLIEHPKYGIEIIETED